MLLLILILPVEDAVNILTISAPPPLFMGGLRNILLCKTENMECIVL
jgi:hypothetical protein